MCIFAFFLEEINMDNLEKQLQDALKLIDAQKKYRHDSEIALKNQIAQALKPEFDDFFESINMPESEQLFEIYREKIKNISKILAQFDICVK